VSTENYLENKPDHLKELLFFKRKILFSSKVSSTHVNKLDLFMRGMKIIIIIKSWVSDAAVSLKQL